MPTCTVGCRAAHRGAAGCGLRVRVLVLTAVLYERMMRALLAVVGGCLAAHVAAVPDVPAQRVPNAALSHMQELSIEQVR